MTPERAPAYQRVSQTLKETGPGKLLGDEQKRSARPQTILCRRDLAQDAPARAAMADIERLCRALPGSARWEKAAAMRLADDVSQGGATLFPDLRAA
jgi:hypothetical protein